MKFIGYCRRHALRIGISLMMVVLLLLNAKGVFHLNFMERLENYTYDMRLLANMPGGVDPRIVIVDIDEKSLQEQGHWPWPRNRLAQLVDLLFDRYKIDVLGFDIFFGERDESSGLKQLEALARSDLAADAGFKSSLSRLRPQLDYDQLFADSLKNRRVVLGYIFEDAKSAMIGDPHASAAPSKAIGGVAVGALPKPALTRNSFDPGRVGALVAGGFIGNLPELQANAMAGGFFSAPLVDVDGVFRRQPMLQMYKGELYEALSLAVARLNLHEKEINLEYVQGDQTELGVEYVKLGLDPRKEMKRWVPVDQHMASLVPYRGRKKSFTYLSATDVLKGTVDPEILRNAIVLVGSTAAGLMDLRSTPVQEIYPGVEIHANLIAGIIDGNIMGRSPNAPSYEFGMIFMVGVVLALALPAVSPLKATILVAALLSFVLGLDTVSWRTSNEVLPFASILLLAALLYVFNMAYGFLTEYHSKRLLSGLFGQYVPPELVDEMAKDPGAYSLEGESRELTVLFSDVRGFTTISEGLDPTQLTQLMNEYLTPMTHVIHQHRGTIDKYMGDAIMAFWGAPLHDPQHARHALLAGMEMLAKLEALQDHFKAKGWPPIKAGVGLNTGEMTVGNMGSEFRLAYTVMGDAVNLGSRLEGLTKEYGVQIMVSEFTRAAVPDFVYRELDRVRVKGKDRPVAIFEPICPQGEEPAGLLEELALYDVALCSYREQTWQQAAEQFAQLQTLHPQRYLYQVYAKRITYLRESPPGPDWDGSFTFTSK